jgi:hypothetical protein
MGRMNLRLFTVIDMKAAPEGIRAGRFDDDIVPLVSAEELRILEEAYEPDLLTDMYYLVTDDPVLLEKVLAALVRIDYAGAIRHVNQLIDVVAVGMANSPDPVNNANVGYLPLDVLQDEAGLMLDGHITELLIRQKNPPEGSLPGAKESSAVIHAALTAALPDTVAPDLGIYRWIDYAGDYLAVSSADDVSSRIIVLLLFILSFLGIANTMLMAILERTKEIGMMRALGMSDGQLLLTYMFEAGMVGLIGSLFGILLGCLINIPMVKYGVDFSGITSQTGGDIGYRISSNFRSAWNIPVIIGSGVTATLLASLMAFFPTRRALKMPVTESLRFE